MNLAEPLVFGGWPVAALLVATRSNPRAIRRQVATRGAIDSPGDRRVAASKTGPFAFLGQFVIALVAKRFPGTPAEVIGRAKPRTVGLSIALVAVGLATVPTATPALAIALGLLRRRQRNRSQRRASDDVARAIPDLIDLIRLALDGGCTVELAFRAVATRLRGALASDVRIVARDLGEGRGVTDALEGLLGRVGEPVRPLCSALLAGERYGVPMATMLDLLSIEARATRRRADEQRARKLPITMLFPLITCTLPAFALLTVVPLLASGLQSVRW